MANTKSSKKRARQNVVRRKINSARKSSVKTAIKNFIAAVGSTEVSLADVRAQWKDAQTKMARARGKGILHRNTVARKMSKLAKKMAVLERREQAATAS